MELNILTYEAWLLDSIEGNLNAKELADLIDFMNLHPELQSELADYAFVPILPQPVFYSQKDSIKKFCFEELMVCEGNLDEFCVAQLEGLLSDSKVCELYNFILLHPKYKATLDVYGLSKLHADLSIGFPLKDQIYRKSLIVPLRRGAIISIAASLLIFISFGYWFNRGAINVDVHRHRVAQILFLKPVLQPVNLRVNQILPLKLFSKQSARVNQKISQPQPKDLNDDSSRLTLIPIREDLAVVVHSLFVNSFQKQSLNLDEELLENTFQPRKSVTLVSFAENFISKFRSSRPSVISVLGAGVNGLGELTSTNLKFKSRRDSVGQISAYSFEAGTWKYYFLGSK